LLFSRPTSYAFRALTFLATQPPGKLSGTREISKTEGIPGSFLGKVLLQLRRGRLLCSFKGIGGGYELALPPDRINLLMIVHCVEGEMPFRQCVLEDQECTAHGECALHESWAGLRDQLTLFLEHMTLAELAQVRQIKAGVSRLDAGVESHSRNGPVGQLVSHEGGSDESDPGISHRSPKSRDSAV